MRRGYQNKDARNFGRGHCSVVGGSQKEKTAQNWLTSVSQEGRAMDTGNCTSTCINMDRRMTGRMDMHIRMGVRTHT